MEPAFTLSAQSCRDARLLLRLTQEELAELGGISVSSVGRFERGERVTAYTARRLAEALEKEGAVFVCAGGRKRRDG